MEDLKQIKTVLLGLGIQVTRIEFTSNPAGSYDTVSQVRTTEDLINSLTVELTLHGRTYRREYTIEQLRSGLVTGPGSGPAARQEQDRKPNGLVSRTSLPEAPP